MGGFLAAVPPELITGGGFASLVFLGFWMVFTGRLVPRSTHEETRTDRDEWRKAFEDLRIANQVQATAQRVQADQVDRLLESAKAAETVMTAIRDTVGRLEGGGR